MILDNAIDVSKQKKVRFTVEEKSKPLGLNSLFSKLKQKKEVTNNDIISKLDVIISNQEKILEFLSDKKEKTMELEAI